MVPSQVVAAVRPATTAQGHVIEDAARKLASPELAIRRALESAGVEFVDENGGGPGVGPRKRVLRSQESRMHPGGHLAADAFAMPLDLRAAPNSTAYN